jgi:fluoride exporter
MLVVAMIAAGGALGAVTRYAVAARLQELLGGSFPYGTLAVNVIGSALLGVVLGLVERGQFSPETRSLLTIGFLGGMTTFSTFIYEGWQLNQAGELIRAVLYAALSLSVAFAAFAASHALVRPAQI